jgi:hypothetical protein
MRVILVGTLVVMTVAAGPALGTAKASSLKCWAQPERQLLMVDQDNGEECCNSGAEFGRGLASVGLNLVYTPFRMVYGFLGAEFGGIAGWATGGDMRASRSLWRPTVDGEYYIRPAHLDGTQRFRFSEATPPESARHRLVAPFTATLRGDDEPLDADPAVEAQPEGELGADEGF